MKKLNMPIGRLLVQLGYITEKDVEQALEVQKRTPGKKLGNTLVEMGLVSEKDMLTVLKEKLDVPLVDLEVYNINPDAIEFVSEELARKYTIFPIDAKNNTLAIATNDPLDFYSLEDVKMISGKDILPVLATKSQIQKCIEKYYSQRRYSSMVDDVTRDFQTEEVQEVDEQEEITAERIDNSPAVKIVNTIVGMAYSKNASDIHIEPYESSLLIRMRIDGELVEVMKLKMNMHSALTTRLKIISNLNIAEKRVPQDGQFRFMINQNSKVDIRISTLPTVNGEKTVLRLLTSERTVATRLDELGMTASNLALYKDILKISNGIVLLTGPTGSGKTTTLYATLNEVNRPNVNITTVEDPVERNLDGINQTQVNVQAGMTFASGLRSILRQDPDIIMIGEIRDLETAQIAVRAAITGHKVFSTLHTNDAVSAVTRLVDMGVEPFMVTSALTGVVAQRLVKKVCPYCKEEYEMPPDEYELVKTTKTAFKGKGCERCNHSGYLDRMAVHEIIAVDTKLRSMVINGANIDDMREYSKKFGKSLQENLADMVARGETTVNELIKLTYHID